MPVSQFVQISDYALIEYVYSNENISTTNARCLRLLNKYTNTYQFLNNAQAYKRTGNILDKSASKLGRDSKVWGYHDIDTPVPIIQSDNNFVLEDVTSSLISPQSYDTVRLYFLAGFTFPGLDGVILELLFNEWTATGLNQRPFTAAAQVFLKSDPSSIVFSPNPIFIADRYFDRYIEFKIPSLYAANLDFWSSPTASNTIGYQYTFGNVGFSNTSQISANIYEITSITESNGNKFLNIGNNWNASFNQQDEYSFIGAVITENPEYDYIEYYPTFHGGFIEDYLNLLNENGQWVVINQLVIYEQVGTNFIKTSDITILQDDNFDQPSIYRPVLRNAPAIYSYSIEYTMRLVNRVNNKEIIRKSSFSSTDPKKYGFQLERINALEGYRPIKVYNKIVKSDNTPSPSVSFGVPKIVTLNNYINNYYDVNFISLDSTTDISSTDIGQTIYPQGSNLFFLSPFDSFVKFKIFTKSKDKKQNVTLDLAGNGMNVKLSFVYDDNSQIFIEPIQDITIANPGSGELLFKIDSETCIKLLAGNNRSYFLVNKTFQGDDVLLYSGKFENIELKNSSENAIKQNELVIAQLQEKINELKTIQDSLTSQPTIINTSGSTGSTGPTGSLVSQNASTGMSPSIAVANKQAAIKAASTLKGISTVTTASASVGNAIVNAVNDKVIKINIPEVPGVTPPLESNNWSNQMPVVKNPSGQDIPVSSINQKREEGIIITENQEGFSVYEFQ